MTSQDQKRQKQNISLQLISYKRLNLNQEQRRNIKSVLGNIFKTSYPASVQLAKFHRNICKYGLKINKIKTKETNSEQDAPICPCCNNQILIEPIPLSYPTSLPSKIQPGHEKFKLSSGICLFFMFVKMCIYYLVLRFIITDCYNIYTNLNGNYCKENPQKCSDFFQSFLAGYNKHSAKDEAHLNVVDFLNFILTLLSIAFFSYFRILFDRVHNFLDHVDITEDDFSIMISGIPSIIRSNQNNQDRVTYFQARDLSIPIQRHLIDVFQTKFYKEIFENSKELKQEYQKMLFNILLGQVGETDLIANVSLCFDLSQFQNLKRIEENIFNELFEDQNSKKQFTTIYCQQFEKEKEAIKEKINNNTDLNQDQKKQAIKDELFRLQAAKIKDIFLKNFRYRIQKEELASNGQNLPDANITKHLIFLNKIEDLYKYARKKYVNKDLFQSNHSFFIGSAFITFQHQRIRNIVLEEYEKNPTMFQINNKPLKIIEPNEPQDIVWQNIKVTTQERRKSVLFSFLILFMCIGFSLIITLMVQNLQIHQTEPHYESEPTLSEQQNHLQELMQQLFQEPEAQAKLIEVKPFQNQIEQKSLIGPISTGSMKLDLTNIQVSNVFNDAMIILTSIINLLLEEIIKKVTQLQKYKSKTEKMKTIINRFVIYKFINTCVIYFILYMVNNKVQILSNNGLMNKIIKLVSLTAVIDIGLNIFLPSPTLKLLYYSYIYKDVSYVNQTQQQLNSELSYPEFDFVERYSYYIVQLYLVSFYGFICPVTVPLVFIIFIIQYWIDKANLFKRCTVNDAVGFKLSQTTLKICSSSLLVFAIGNIFFYQIINIYENFHFTALNIVTFFISLTFVIIQYRAPQLITDFFYKSERLNIYQSYRELSRNNMIPTTYWSENPATTRSAKTTDIQQQGLKIQESTLNQSLRLYYDSFSTIQALSKIFLPYDLEKYWKWNQKYQGIFEKYDVSDKELYQKCFNIKKQTSGGPQ